LTLAAIKVQKFIAKMFPGQSERGWSDLLEIAKLTALRVDNAGEYYISNFWRGPMLYSLVRSLKPAGILELGTGRGYGAFCMAQALVDGGIDSKLITVDRTPSDRPYDWAYVNETQQNVIKNISLNDFWNEYLPASLNERIDFQCGDTASVHRMFSDSQDNLDFVFIDSDHTYNGVALDFLSAHNIVAKNAVFVFDDYSTASGYGIRKLIDEELSRFYSIQIVDMELTAAHDMSVDHKMAICNTEAEDIEAEFARPSDLRFKYLMTRRRLRGGLVSLMKLLKRCW